MRRICILIMTAMVTLAGCKGNIAPSVESAPRTPLTAEEPATQSLLSPKTLTDEAKTEIDDFQIDAPVFPKLFTEFFMMYAKHEKSFAWEDVANDLEAAGYWLFYPTEDDFSFIAFDHDNEDISMACDFATSNDAGPGRSVTGNSDEISPYLTMMGYYANLNFEGVIVEFQNGRDKYYVDDSSLNPVEVRSLGDAVGYLAGLMTG